MDVNNNNFMNYNNRSEELYNRSMYSQNRNYKHKN
ncbi:hypothetical protein C923_02110 [Plasmodium falciparum UGT5.1]|uniref:Uncharacterized protein n=5 Tax=Plasmodium falciparum TaxID=5833 RepID=W4IS72_PLAFP|nr:hypothetical protein PFFVO_02003 [Plasmodium falciparum Vietnam Oak-Knoll (FVO)]ETW31305.1 hypothetical protein PFFCH_01325 [Plasmodium falciparum FCH/4]ETW49942.1 hypothetical protein PFMALIP_02023 [Plasmodium falciparum MaliPS096_E11]ETW52589.1 hypothetical protein PFUGPA_05595 [Plasmodium falciparum Palo Alto/Uganda]EWC77223.1 hypothetical protein C923_02110 [Plasmodium falciparum UGT5.1]